MTNHNETPVDDEGFPELPENLKRTDSNPKEASSMKTPEKNMATDDSVAAAETTVDTPAPAPKMPAANGVHKGKARPAKAKQAKPAAKQAKAKPTVKAKAPAKAKAKEKTTRQRDPAKLDKFGFRQGSVKSIAAARYAKGKGATLAEVKEEVGSVQFNLITELENRGFKFERSEVQGAGPRMATRYKLLQK